MDAPSENDKRKEVYYSNRQALVETKARTNEHIDKMIVTISTAGLGLIFGWMSREAKDFGSFKFGFMIAACVGFGLTILLVLISHHVSNYIFGKQIKNWDNWLKDELSEVGFVKQSSLIFSINLAASGTFVLAIILMGSFAIIPLR
jgi:hypothetical protein